MNKALVLPPRGRTGQDPPAVRQQAAVEVGLDHLIMRYGNVAAVDDVSLEIGAGEFLALLGPSGSGKTTILMTIAGFVRPTSGDVRMAGRSVVDVPPETRGIGVVFQGYALFPHLSVQANVAFPLEMAGMPRREMMLRIERVLRLVGLEGYGGRYPHEVSGGQQQRVALARALVFEPGVLLLDEPLGALDKQRRSSMQHEFRALHRELGTTIVYVTHDQQEALAMADRIAVMHEGKLIQVGSPREVYCRPRDRFVAGFIGDCNFLPIDHVERVGSTVRVVVAGYSGEAPASDVPHSREPSLIGVRPHHAALTPSPSAEGVLGYVKDVVFLGELVEHLVALPSGEGFRTRQIADEASLRFTAGQPVRITWRWQEACLF